MSTLTKNDILGALAQLGAIAHAEGMSIRLLVVGGAAMALGFDARQSTKDVDVLILEPSPSSLVREWARIIGDERGWTDAWLNDGAKGYLMGVSQGPVLLASPGIEVLRPATEQLLAMKLCAWRDDLDVSDAARLLLELSDGTEREKAWDRIAPFLLPGRELKAEYAFNDLWELQHGDN